MLPIVERIVFGLNRSTVVWFMITPVMPAPSPVRTIVPRFPGSWMLSKIRRCVCSPLSISSNAYSGFFITQRIPCGVCVSETLLNTLSETIS